MTQVLSFASALLLTTVVACTVFVEEPDDASLSGDPPGGDDSLVLTSVCSKVAENDILILGLPGTSSVALQISDAYDLAVDIMDNHAVIHDHLEGTWSDVSGVSNAGGRCYPILLRYDLERDVIEVTGFECESNLESYPLEVDSVLCPAEF